MLFYNPFTARIIAGLFSLVMLVFFFSPIRMLAFYIVMRPLVQPFGTLQYKLFNNIPLTSIFSILLITSAYINGFFKKDNTLRHPQILPLYFMLFFSVISVYFSLNFLNSIGQMLKILTGLSLYILCFNAVQSKKDANKILWIYLISSTIPMLFGYYQYLTGTGHAWLGVSTMGYRIDSVLCEWNAYGEFLCLNVCVAFMLLINETKSVRRMLIIGALASLMISLILSLNRGSWIGLGLALISATFVYIRKVKVTWIVLGLVIVGLASSGIIISRFEMLHEERPWGGGTKNTFQGRINAWKVLLPVALKRPITGHGVGTIREITKKYLKNTIIPHNDYLLLCLEIGIPGALLYILFLFSELIRSLKNVSKTENWNINYPFLMVVIYFIILSAVQNIIQNLVVFPMFLGLAGLTHKVNTIKLPNNRNEISQATNFH